MGFGKETRSMSQILLGKIFYCGDYVDTDVMSPGRFDPIYEDEKLKKIALIDYKGKEPFVDEVLGHSKFNIILAGRDFGCGSSRETAPMALAAAGVKVIVAQSFARIFFRNCVNLGQIYPLELSHNFDARVHGMTGEVNFLENTFRVGESSFSFQDLGILKSIFESGGLSQYVAKKGGFSCL